MCGIQREADLFKQFDIKSTLPTPHIVSPLRDVDNSDALRECRQTDTPPLGNLHMTLYIKLNSTFLFHISLSCNIGLIFFNFEIKTSILIY